MPTSGKLDENWTKTTDASERRRIQNRLAQRNYRNNIKQRLRQLELLNAGKPSRCEKSEDEEFRQKNHTMADPLPQSVARSDNNCSWLTHQSEASVPGHAEIQIRTTSQIEPNQYIFDFNPPITTKLLSSPLPDHRYNYFTDPHPPQEQHTALNFDGQSFDQITVPSEMQLQLHNLHGSTGQKPDPATQPRVNVGLVRTVNSDNTLPVPQHPAAAVSTPLHHAAANGHLQIVRFLILSGANLAARNEVGQTVLHIAAQRGYESVLEQALTTQRDGGDTKALIDWVDDEGFTALHRAAAGGHEECVRILVEAGADIDHVQ